jgi:hypothetical protein
MRKGQKMTPEQRAQVSARMMGEKNQWFGKTFSAAHRRKIKISINKALAEGRLSRRGQCIGIKNWAWRGEKVGYYALHSWIRRVKVRANHCEDCGRDTPPIGKGIKRNYFQWANISGQYLRELTDWKPLCYKCHKQFDGARRKVIA